MKIIIEVELGNEAMQTSKDVRNAVYDALFGESEYTPFEIGNTGMIADDNGNTVGRWDVVES